MYELLHSDALMRLLLLGVKPWTMGIILIIGFLLGRRSLMQQTLFLVLFTIILNTCLKCIWKIPLPFNPTWFAFPSGHMSATIVFYGWLAMNINKPWIYAIAGVIYASAAVGMLHFHYHTPPDLFGSVLLMAPLLWGYKHYVQIFKNNSALQGGILVTLGLIFILCTPIPPHAIKDVLSTEAVFLGVWIISMIFHRAPWKKRSS